MYEQIILVGGSQLAKQCLNVLTESTVIPSAHYNTDNMQKKEVMQLLEAETGSTLVLSIMNRYLFTSRVLGNQRLKIVNLHHAVLPGHRGLNAQAWAIFNEETEAGFTWHLVDSGVDTGSILEIERFPILETDTALSVLRRQNRLIPGSLRQLLPMLLADKFSVRQPEDRPSFLHRGSDVPNGGILDWGWSGHKMSCFLRAMDFGVLQVMGKPSVEWQGGKYHIKSYSIERIQEVRELSVTEQQGGLVIDKDGYRITLRQLLSADGIMKA